MNTLAVQNISNHLLRLANTQKLHIKSSNFILHIFFFLLSLLLKFKQNKRTGKTNWIDKSEVENAEKHKTEMNVES